MPPALPCARAGHRRYAVIAPASSHRVTPWRGRWRWPVRRCICAVALGIVPCVSVSAQDAPDTGLLNRTQVTGDWGGSRSTLEGRGVRFSVYFLHNYGHKDTGGFEPIGLGRHSGSIDLFGQLDFDRMNAIPGGESLIHVKGNWGSNVNLPTGALSDPIDDADGTHALRIAQLWYQQSTPDRTLQVRLGYLDQQTMLDRNTFANSEDRQFMSTFLDNNNAIVPLAIGPGVAVFYNATDWLSFVVSAADANSRPFAFSFATAFDGEYFTYFETDVQTRVPSATGPLTGNYRVGVFTDPRDSVFFGTDRVDRRNGGVYLSVDQALYGESTGDEQGLGLFVRYGWRPADVNRVTHVLSGGAQYQGLFPGGELDVLGVGVYSAAGSSLYRNHIDSTFDRETAYEVYYALQVSPAVGLTPALHYVKQPGALTTRDSVVIFAVRGRISL